GELSVQRIEAPVFLVNDDDVIDPAFERTKLANGRAEGPRDCARRTGGHNGCRRCRNSNVFDSVHFHFYFVVNRLDPVFFVSGMDGIVKTMATIARHCFSRMSAELQFGEKEKDGAGREIMECGGKRSESARLYQRKAASRFACRRTPWLL